ncbi:hypothetical protein BDV96DRAFT_628393 [Lophiotrema nucula]|uniref:Uncharacterized protein n=1 Tax=Lophiotrema nucula TaxID=690887 RepID=A0A6A5ZP47_9PLEO|nr:hypothetical protein BDV96DRAFT_628393 [Lophiotrema nucula]
MSLTDCTSYPDLTTDASFCSSLGPESQSLTSEIHYTRFFSLTRVSSWSDPYTSVLASSSNTQFDRCLPGPASCNSRYSSVVCPDGWDGMGPRVTKGTTSEWCCPRYTYLTASLAQYPNVLDRSTASGEASATEVPICEYDWWAYTANGILPTSLPPTQDGDGDGCTSCTRLVMSIRPLQVAYTGTPSITTAPTTSSTSLPAIAPSTSTPASSSGSLSTKTKIGIGVGSSVSFVLIVAVGVALFILLRRNRRQKRALDGMKSSDKPELDGQTVERHQITRELTGTALREIDGKPLLAEARGDRELLYELQDTSKPVEIGGRERPHI